MRSTWCALVGALLLLGVACGTGGSGNAQRVTLEATPAAMQRAADATVAKTAKVDMKLSMSLLGQQVEITGTGAVDPANRRMTMSLDMQSMFEGIAEAQGESIPPDVESMFGEPMTMIVDGTTMYIHFPVLAARLGGKEWVKVDIEKATGLSGALGAGGGTDDPSAVLQFLRGAKEVQEVGREEIRGEQTTHFNGSYTLQEALDAAPESSRGSIERAMQGLGAGDELLDTPIPFDAWIGDDGTVRRFDMTMDMKAFAPSSASSFPGGAVTYSMEFHDFGTEVTLDLPSDDEVTDMTDVLASQSKFSSVASSIN